MKTFRSGILVGFFTALILVLGCATQFPYRFYNAQIKSRAITEADVGKDLATLAYQEGVLLGKLGSDGWPDRPFADCQPDPIPSPGASPAPSPNLMKCTTLATPEFYSLKADDEKCHSDLDVCQHQPPSP